jgi:hypothetical protein
MLYAPKLRTDAEMTPPDEEDAEERERMDLEHCDQELHRRFKDEGE